MKHPLTNYRKIANPDFISCIEEKFYSDYHDELIKGLYVDVEKDKDRMKITGVDVEGNDFGSYVSLGSYFLKEYNELEKETRSNVDKIILSFLDEKKQQVLIKNTIAELKALQVTIGKISVLPKYEVYRSILSDKIDLFSMTLNNIYLIPQSRIIPKIQWLDKTNILTTLIYDLWQGQQKGKLPSTKQFIKAEKKDLEQLLINNFLDCKGQPLKASVLSDYLNTSKPEKKAKRGIRIELN